MTQRDIESDTPLADERRRLVESFRDKAYRDAFVASRLASGIAFKMRATRKDRDYTQGALASLSGTKQSVISRFEQRNYGNYSIGSLRKIFAALDVALIVDAIPYSEFIDRILALSPEDMAIPSFDEDPGLWNRQGDGQLILEVAETTDPDNLTRLDLWRPQYTTNNRVYLGKTDTETDRNLTDAIA